MKRFLWSASLWIFYCLTTPTATQASPNTKQCHKLTNNKNFPDAGVCFLQQAAKFKHSSQLSKFDKRAKGLHLINAGKAFLQASQKTKKREERAYFLERTLHSYQQYIKEELCLKRYKCQKIKASLWQLNKQIGYAQLTIVMSNGQKAEIELKGHEVDKTLSVPPTQTQKLRPGKYTLHIKYSEGPTQRLALILKPESSRVLTLPTSTSPLDTTPKTNKPFPSWLPWAAIGGGALLASVGATLTGVSFAQYDALKLKADNYRQNPTGDPIQARDVQSQYEGQKGMYTGGVILLCTGLVIAAGGVGLLFWPSQTTPTLYHTQHSTTPFPQRNHALLPKADKDLQLNGWRHKE